MAEQMFGDERSVTRSTHGNREFADLSLLLCNIHNHPTGTLIAVCISGVHHCCFSYSWTGVCCWAACPICFSIGGRCARKESTCSIIGVLLDSDNLPMGVMRERGMARCCMIDNAEERCWASEDGEMRVQVQMQMWWDVLSWGENWVVQRNRRSE